MSALTANEACAKNLVAYPDSGLKAVNCEPIGVAVLPEDPVGLVFAACDVLPDNAFLALLLGIGSDGRGRHESRRELRRGQLGDVKVCEPGFSQNKQGRKICNAELSIPTSRK